ncbi:MAG: outer membrane protein transport protein [bacterium]
MRPFQLQRFSDRPPRERTLLRRFRFLTGLFGLMGISAFCPPAVPPAHSNVADSLGLGARAVALGGAYTALADDFSAVYYNPAGLRGEKESSLTLGGLWAKPWLYVRQEGEETEHPHLYATGAAFLGVATNLGHLTGYGQLRPWTLGLCLYLPIERALMADIPGQSSDRKFIFYLDDTQVLAILAGLAWEITPWLSVGVSGNFLADLRAPNEAVADVDIRTVLPYLAHLGDLTKEVRPRIMRDTELKVSPIAGVRLQPLSWLTLGLTYRGRIYGETVGTQDILLRFTDFSGESSARLQLAVLGEIHYVHFWKPNQVSAGSAFTLFNSLRIALDLTWADWSDYLDPMWYRPAIGFHDTWTPRLGLEQTFRNGIALRAGYAFQPTPVPDQTRASNYLDCDRHIASLGAGYTFSRIRWLVFWKKPLTLDAYIQYIQLARRTYHKEDPALYGRDLTLGGNLLHGGVSVTLHY